MNQVNSAQSAHITELVDHFKQHIESFERLGQGILHVIQDARLRPYVHSVRWRVKDPAHLADKLARKCLSCEKEKAAFDIDKNNLFARINDLVGIRILHLHTDQFADIDRVLKELLDEEEYAVLEGPSARIWDAEYRAFFEGIGVSTQENLRMYTSVHYVVSGKSKTPRTAEIQVRTLAEEIWGEVDHQINYPHPTDQLPLSEQIRVLARVTSSCTRLVDSIFRCRKP